MDNPPTIPSELTPLDSQPGKNQQNPKAHPILAILGITVILLSFAFLFRH